MVAKFWLKPRIPLYSRPACFSILKLITKTGWGAELGVLCRTSLSSNHAFQEVRTWTNCPKPGRYVELRRPRGIPKIQPVRLVITELVDGQISV